MPKRPNFIPNKENIVIFIEKIKENYSLLIKNKPRLVTIYVQKKEVEYQFMG